MIRHTQTDICTLYARTFAQTSSSNRISFCSLSEVCHCLTFFLFDILFCLDFVIRFAITVVAHGILILNNIIWRNICLCFQLLCFWVSHMCHFGSMFRSHRIKFSNQLDSQYDCILYSYTTTIYIYAHMIFDIDMIAYARSFYIINRQILRYWMTRSNSEQTNMKFWNNYAHQQFEFMYKSIAANVENNFESTGSQGYFFCKYSILLFAVFCFSTRVRDSQRPLLFLVFQPDCVDRTRVGFLVSDNWTKAFLD